MDGGHKQDETDTEKSPYSASPTGEPTEGSTHDPKIQEGVKLGHQTLCESTTCESSTSASSTSTALSKKIKMVDEVDAKKKSIKKRKKGKKGSRGNQKLWLLATS